MNESKIHCDIVCVVSFHISSLILFLNNVHCLFFRLEPNLVHGKALVGMKEAVSEIHPVSKTHEITIINTHSLLVRDQ